MLRARCAMEWRTAGCNIVKGFVKKGGAFPHAKQRPALLGRVRLNQNSVPLPQGSCRLDSGVHLPLGLLPHPFHGRGGHRHRCDVHHPGEFCCPSGRWGEKGVTWLYCRVRVAMAEGSGVLWPGYRGLKRTGHCLYRELGLFRISWLKDHRLQILLVQCAGSPNMSRKPP